MVEVITDLEHKKLINQAYIIKSRQGKTIATNILIEESSGDIIINIDADTEIESINEMLSMIDNCDYGAVSGNIGVRNWNENILTLFQTIEYLITIDLNKTVMNFYNMVSNVSGAFGGFERNCIRKVGNMSLGPGEDLDTTLKIKLNGYKVGFSRNSWCFTDVPNTLSKFFNQRLRWERDPVRILYRKYKTFDTFHLEHILFNLLPSIVFPFYILFLFSYYSVVISLHILTLIYVIYMIFDLFLLYISISKTSKIYYDIIQLVFAIPFYSLYSNVLIKYIRIVAFLQEFIFEYSYKDNYIPKHIQVKRERY